LAAGFCPKNLAFDRKIVVLPESGGLQPLAPLARVPMVIGFRGIDAHDGAYGNGRRVVLKTLSYLVFILQEVVDGFNENPVKLGMKAIQAAVHANSYVGSINASYQRRNTYLTVSPNTIQYIHLRSQYNNDNNNYY